MSVFDGITSKHWRSAFRLGVVTPKPKKSHRPTRIKLDITEKSQWESRLLLILHLIGRERIASVVSTNQRARRSNKWAWSYLLAPSFFPLHLGLFPLHICTSTSGPSQISPPNWGAGPSHSRDLVWYPLSQVALHPLQAAHRPQWPFKGTGIKHRFMSYN